MGTKMVWLGKFPLFTEEEPKTEINVAKTLHGRLMEPKLREAWFESYRENPWYEKDSR